MANNLQRVHGDSQAVFAIDTRNGPIAPSTAPANTQTNFIGPELAFFNIQTGVSMAAQMDTGGAVEAMLRTIAQTATVMIYQVDSGTGGNLSVGVYPVGAWATTTASPADGSGNLVAAIQALGTVNTVSLAGAAATNVGFKLAQA